MGSRGRRAWKSIHQLVTSISFSQILAAHANKSRHAANWTSGRHSPIVPAARITLSTAGDADREGKIRMQTDQGKIEV
jgi:hypothetical protein